MMILQHIIILLRYELVEIHADYQVRFYDNILCYICDDIVCFIFYCYGLVYNK
jgi:hypothetical protein